MAGHARYTALLDACVLFMLAVCDSLISVAATGLYAPKWTQRIKEEWTRSLEQKSGRPPGSYSGRRDAMRDAAPDWEVAEQAGADGFGLVARARRIHRATSPAQGLGLHAIGICRRP